jgi:hypothetical protein
MKGKYVVSNKHSDGRMRFYVLPIESKKGFQDLIEFVSQQFDGEFGKLEEGPGTIYQKGIIYKKEIVFVLSDMYGTQFYAEDESNDYLAEEIAHSIEIRIREVMTK